MRNLLISILCAFTLSACTPAFAQQCVPRDEQIEQVVLHPQYQSHQMLDADQTVRALAALGADDVGDVKYGLWLVRQDAVSFVVAWLKDGTCGYSMSPPEAGPVILKAVRGTEF